MANKHLATRLLGTLGITVLRAYDLRDVSTFGTMSPQVTININGEKMSTPVVADGGNACSFNHSLSFRLDCQPGDVVLAKIKHVQVHVEALDLIADETIGIFSTTVGALLAQRGKRLKWELVDSDHFQPAGVMEIQVGTYEGENAPPLPTSRPSATASHTHTPRATTPAVTQSLPFPADADGDATAAAAAASPRPPAAEAKRAEGGGKRASLGGPPNLVVPGQSPDKGAPLSPLSPSQQGKSAPITPKQLQLQPQQAQVAKTAPPSPSQGKGHLPAAAASSSSSNAPLLPAMSLTPAAAPAAASTRPPGASTLLSSSGAILPSVGGSSSRQHAQSHQSLPSPQSQPHAQQFWSSPSSSSSQSQSQQQQQHVSGHSFVLSQARQDLAQAQSNPSSSFHSPTHHGSQPPQPHHSPVLQPLSTGPLSPAAGKDRFATGPVPIHSPPGAVRRSTVTGGAGSPHGKTAAGRTGGAAGGMHHKPPALMAPLPAVTAANPPPAYTPPHSSNQGGGSGGSNGSAGSYASPQGHAGVGAPGQYGSPLQPLPASASAAALAAGTLARAPSRFTPHATPCAGHAPGVHSSSSPSSSAAVATTTPFDDRAHLGLRGDARVVELRVWTAAAAAGEKGATAAAATGAVQGLQLLYAQPAPASAPGAPPVILEGSVAGSSSGGGKLHSLRLEEGDSITAVSGRFVERATGVSAGAGAGAGGEPIVVCSLQTLVVGTRRKAQYTYGGSSGGSGGGGSSGRGGGGGSGGGGGKDFSLRVPENHRVVGFHGSFVNSGDICTLGAYTAPISGL